MKPDDCKPGIAVLYQPTVGPGRPKYRGTVREPPWQLGGGTWVTHLSDMDPAYGADTGRAGRTTVHAAVVEHLELAPEATPDLETATAAMNPMGAAKAFRAAADSIGSWPASKIDELARACKLNDVTAPVRGSAAMKALDQVHQEAWNAAIECVITTLQKFGGLDGGTEKVMLKLKSTVRR